MTVGSKPKGFMLILAVLLVSVVVHGLLTATFCIGALALVIPFLKPDVSGWPEYKLLFLAAVPMLWCGYTRASDVASAEIARTMIWLFYGERVPR